MSLASGDNEQHAGLVGSAGIRSQPHLATPVDLPRSSCIRNHDFLITTFFPVKPKDIGFILIIYTAEPAFHKLIALPMSLPRECEAVESSSDSTPSTSETIASISSLLALCFVEFKSFIQLLETCHEPFTELSVLTLQDELGRLKVGLVIMVLIGNKPIGCRWTIASGKLLNCIARFGTISMT